jgi:hypothetical protein
MQRGGSLPVSERRSRDPKDQSNQRKYQPGYAAWEIHPVMKLTGQ